ncbi:hypothetical protein AHMF7616_03057 [Adhaeribacter pallidiroseus]|uniref:Uncharacterized protein n=1 Tax=Adhaeribacter pallidiroseus TaxID=2072847 RepID=A0A369QHQ5_9BACT|nr:hypothetical protein AHMF7616_03057 [Adhaeribacter pallidiroseus]
MTFTGAVLVLLLVKAKDINYSKYMPLPKNVTEYLFPNKIISQIKIYQYSSFHAQTSSKFLLMKVHNRWLMSRMLPAIPMIIGNIIDTNLLNRYFVIF